MDPRPPRSVPAFSETDVEVLNCYIAAPSHQVAAEWLGYSSTHLRRLLKLLRERFNVDTNIQLIVLASHYGAIDARKVLPHDTCVLN
ncbi:hypothetical protein [Glycomyces salinus]|uniref:hypothetical protein n=1 Tax=Glycomyces salinus TaxID=980294 RepID=UPI0018EBBF1E|nr:hypothetical protein [Glycomyces salinus]